jgi:hypothetical protein
MTFQSIQAVTAPSQSLTSEYIPTGTDLDEARQWAILNGKELGDGLDDLSDDFADAGFVPRDDSTV